MNKKTINKLSELNRQFYQRMASQFSNTRRHIQPGVESILDLILGQSRVLDLGCGNGELARVLLARGYHGNYFGIDSSQELLEIARENISEEITVTRATCEFTHADITLLNWEKVLPYEKHNIILAFAVLHHIPGNKTRFSLFTKVRNLLKSDGLFIFSNWQFMNSERLRERIQPWESINLSEIEVENGDYLLDWRGGGYALRYIHLFNQMELQELAEQCGFEILRSFSSDGKEGNLGLYQIWKIAQ